MFSTDMVTGVVTNRNVNATNYGNISVGLIWGSKQYNYGYGLRKAQRFAIHEEYQNPIKGVTASVLSFVCVACLFNIIGTIFSLENFFIVPVQTLQGPIGLYLWYGIASIAAFIAFFMYSILFPTKLKEDIDSEAESNFSSVDGETGFGYSYWLLMTGIILTICNIGLVHLARKSLDLNTLSGKLKPKARPAQYEDTSDGGLL